MPPVSSEAQSDDLRTRADAFDWFHSIDLGHGVVTKGGSDPSATLRLEQLPALSGKTVLDIGAWDGYYSFLAEKCGASRVVALDHYVWGVDRVAREPYWQECRERGTFPDHSRDMTDFWRPDLPGRRGFDMAKEALGSNVECVVDDFAAMDLEALGTFDVVLYLGVRYHMKEPFTCLERVRAVTREVAVIETAALHVAGTEGIPLLRFLPGAELNRDFGNWFEPNIEAITAMVSAAGFSKVEVVQGPPLPPETVPPRRGRRARSVPEASTRSQYRAIVHAFV